MSSQEAVRRAQDRLADPVFDTVAAALVTSHRVGGRNLSTVLDGLGRSVRQAVQVQREGVPELLSMADAWQSALEQGLPLGQAMLTLAETVRERKRARLLEEGGKSTVRMLFPVALFIFPVFLVVLLYPAGVELLGLGG